LRSKKTEAADTSDNNHRLETGLPDGLISLHDVILPSSKARRENLWTPAAQPATVAPALALDPPLAFGSRRMTARMILSAETREKEYIADTVCPPKVFVSCLVLAVLNLIGVTLRLFAAKNPPSKRKAACASHASRLVKCDVLKLRPDPFESGAAPAFPSVPPTKSGEFAHFKSDRPTRWRFFWLRPCHESPGRASNQARTCVRVLLQRTPKAGCALHIALCRCTGLCPRLQLGTSTNGGAPVQKLWSLWVSCGKGRKSGEKLDDCTGLSSVSLQKRQRRKRAASLQCPVRIGPRSARRS